MENVLEKSIRIFDDLKTLTGKAIGALVKDNN